MPQDDDRHITDDDAKAIARALRVEMLQQFYSDLGRGVWAIVWRVTIITLVAIAAYGANKGVN
jgi:hypothetical protein